MARRGKRNQLSVLSEILAPRRQRFVYMQSKKFALKESGRLGKNVGYAILSQGVSLASSVLMSIVVPKILGIEDYAYWQLFVLYSGYVGLTLFGVHDGINLRLGGVKIADVDWPRIKTEFLIVLTTQAVIAVSVIAAITVIDDLGGRSTVVLLVVLYGLIANPASFLFYLLRAANLPNIFSTASFFSGLFWVAFLIVLTILKPEGFVVYVFLYVLCQLASSVYCYLHFTEVFSCRCAPLSAALADLRADCAAGLKVTVAYYAGSLIVGSCRMLIDAHWGLEVFGKFSLSVSLVNFLLAFMAQVSMVIFPVVRRMDNKSRARTYGLLRSTLVSILPLIYLLYFPGAWLLGLWLPQYTESLSYLAIMLPICVFDCKMQLIVSTYLKTFRKENALLWLNATTLGVSLAVCSISTFVFSNLIMTTISMVAAIALRSFISEIYIGRFLGTLNWRVLVSELILAVWFMVSAYIYDSSLAAAMGVLLFYVANRKDVKGFLQFAKRRYSH
jgi:O-antigen/teichoic acid export membrane protein